ncbi:MAG: type VI secretion system baseplate subunit TssK [Byssovorax sp.]
MRDAKDVPHAVNWHDGLLLSPHHFQESWRRSERLLEFHLGYAAPYHFGVKELSIDEGLLIGGIFRVTELEAVLPDNVIVHHGKTDENLDADLRPHEAILRRSACMVYLALLRDDLGGGAIDSDLSRYRSAELKSDVDVNTGEGAIPIARVIPKIQLVVAPEPPTRFVCLPLARVQIDGEAYVRDPSYIPPLLYTQLASPLGKLCSQIINKLREKATRLAEKEGALSLATDRDQKAELRRQIQCLVTGLPVFEAMLYAGREHPYRLFLGLAGMLGEVAALGRKPIPPMLPAYDHNDLAVSFRTAQDHLFRLINEGILESFTAYPLSLDRGYYGVEFLREWQGRTMVLAARARRGVPEEDILKWMDGALIGPGSRAQEMMQYRSLGVTRNRVQKAGNGDLVATTGTFLYDLVESADYMIPGEPLLVFNTADPSGSAGPDEFILYVKTSP